MSTMTTVIFACAHLDHRALEREHGKDGACAELKEWYDNLDSSEYRAVFEEPDWLNQ